MKIEAGSVHDYVSKLNPDHQADIAWVIGLVAKHGGKEVVASFDYGMPTFKLGEVVVLSVAQQKNYISVYADVDTVERHRGELGRLRVGKSCIRFTDRSKIDAQVLGVIIKESVDAARTRPGPFGSSAGGAPAKKVVAKKVVAKKVVAKKVSAKKSLSPKK